MITTTDHPATRSHATPNPKSSPGLNPPAATRTSPTPRKPASLLEHNPPAVTATVAASPEEHSLSLLDPNLPAANSFALPNQPPLLAHHLPTAIDDPASKAQSPSGASPLLALAADVLEDAERNRIANENRLRQLTRAEEDSDGEERGFGLDESHPDVAKLAVIVTMLRKVEHEAALNLQQLMRKHQLGPWVKAQKGVGEKQAARLLAAVGDPYWNTLHNRPRTVSELWAFCGLHTVATGGDQKSIDAHRVTVAARRTKGQRANWSSKAKSRAYLISVSMLKSGNRAAYDKRKAATQDRDHSQPCVRCGPAGKPAETGSPWSLAHRHADALRYQAKEMLRQLWAEAKRIANGEEQIAA